MSEKDSLPRYLVEGAIQAVKSVVPGYLEKFSHCVEPDDLAKKIAGGYFSNVGPKTTTACNCIGPQDGQPLCPCMMRNVKIIDGRYVQIKDLGPVK